MENIEQRVKKIVAEQLGVNEGDDQERIVVRRRPRRRLARHGRAGDGARGGIRDRDPGRGSREDHDRPAGDRLHQAPTSSRIAATSARDAAATVDARRRVVVTGLGIVSPVGNSVDEAWPNIARRASPASPASPASMPRAFAVAIAGEVKGFDVAHVPVAEGSAALGHVHPLRHGRRRCEAMARLPASQVDAGRTPSASASTSARASAACR